MKDYVKAKERGKKPFEESLISGEYLNDKRAVKNQDGGAKLEGTGEARS